MNSRIIALLALVAVAALSGCGKQSKSEVATRDNMHKIHSAFMDYSEDNQDQWPESLDDLKPYVKDFDTFMTNPITGDNPGYLYTPPGAESESDDDEDFVMLIQLRNGQPDHSLRKLYSNGSVKH